jgi:hypothetical protein
MLLTYINVSSQSNVQSTQEIVELILDSNRNALLALDLKVSQICDAFSLSHNGISGIYCHNGSWDWCPRGWYIWHEREENSKCALDV